MLDSAEMREVARALHARRVDVEVEVVVAAAIRPRLKIETAPQGFGHRRRVGDSLLRKDGAEGLHDVRDAESGRDDR